MAGLDPAIHAVPCAPKAKEEKSSFLKKRTKKLF
jgi:hypothetical protein